MSTPEFTVLVVEKGLAQVTTYPSLTECKMMQEENEKGEAYYEGDDDDS